MNFIIFRKLILYIKRCALITLIIRTYLHAGFFPYKEDIRIEKGHFMSTSI